MAAFLDFFFSFYFFIDTQFESFEELMGGEGGGDEIYLGEFSNKF